MEQSGFFFTHSLTLCSPSQIFVDNIMHKTKAQFFLLKADENPQQQVLQMLWQNDSRPKK